MQRDCTKIHKCFTLMLFICHFGRTLIYMQSVYVFVLVVVQQKFLSGPGCSSAGTFGSTVGNSCWAVLQFLAAQNPSGESWSPSLFAPHHSGQPSGASVMRP